MISFAHRTVFIHVPKCGGQSVELAFLDHLGLSWQNRGALLLGRKPAQWGGQNRHLAHLKAEEYLRFGYITPLMWSQFFTFAVVRNPFARVASAFHYLDPARESLEAFALSLDSKRNGFLDPAWHYVRGEDGRPLVSAWYRLEDLGDNWPAIAARARLGRAPLPHRNAGGEKRREAVWTPAAIDAVQEVYAEDFNHFGYATEAPPEAGRTQDTPRPAAAPVSRARPRKAKAALDPTAGDRAG